MIRFLLNPGGGRGRAAQVRPRLAELARAADAELVVSRDTDDLTAQAWKAAAEGVERLLVAGGDGTMHYVIQGLTGTDTALAALPLGSGNDIACTLGMPLDLEAAVQQALSAPIRPMDLGHVGDRFYGGVAGVGFDSAANETANQVKRLKGPLIYIYSVLHTLATFRPISYTIDYEGGRFEGPGMMMVMANGPRLGGGMRIAPAARVDDGRLDLVVIRKVSKLTFLRVFPHVYKGTHVSHPCFFTARTPWAQVRLDREMHVYGDGERLVRVGPDGVRFEVRSGPLRAVRAR